jgi:histidinol dehydrogenase
MKLMIHPHKTQWPELVKRPQKNRLDLSGQVNDIIEQVKKKGDEAIRELTKKFDGTTVLELEVTPSEIVEAGKLVPAALEQAIRLAMANITKFHKPQVIKEQKIETAPGVWCWRKNIPIQKVGLYVPGGTAPLFSTVLMLGIPAAIAGCREIILCTPPDRNGKIHPAVLFAASVVGINRIYKAGGAQAIAAMAYGTGSIPAVSKIFGPGNQYVTAAKQLVSTEGVAIDMPAGPSEVAVFADASANPEYVAADLLSQAEHGTDSQVLFVTTDKQIAEDVQLAVSNQLEKLPRKAIAKLALDNSSLVIVPDAATGMELINEYAPEHLILACENAESLAEIVINAGSVFIGHLSPESAGDYASGTNHTLPTNGYAKAYSGVSVMSFMKQVTFQQLTAEGLQSIGPAVMEMAAAEGLEGHANAISIRMKK